jgi:hypothetical protein
MPIGANMAMRRSVVDRLGGLRTDLGKLRGTLRSGEDHELHLRMLRARLRGVYEPSAIVRHFVPAARLTRAYFRRWYVANGRVVARLEPAYPTTARYHFGVPTYLWGQAVGDARLLARALLTADARARFTHSTRLLWFGGFLGETWLNGARRSRHADEARGKPHAETT